MALPTWWVPVAAEDVWNPRVNPDPMSGDWIPLYDQEGPGSASVARDDGTATLVGLIPAHKEYSAHLNIVGCAYADLASPWAMHRVNPLPHPLYRQMRAVSADFVDFNPVGRDQEGTAVSVAPAPYLADEPEGAVRLPWVLNTAYKKVTIKFRVLNYAHYEDAQMTTGGETPTPLPEVYRNTSFFEEITPRLEILLTGSEPFLKWGDGPNVNQDIVLPIPDYIQKADLIVVWHAVPYEFIIPPGLNYLPTKIMAGVGCVNSAAWYGFPAGTLKLEAPRYRKNVQAPVRVLPDFFGFLPTVYDVILPFTFNGKTNDAGSPVFPQGHNLSIQPATGKWYSVLRKNAVGSVGLFRPYDFNKLFEHVSA